MRDGMAETVAEAEAQELPSLAFGAWRYIAGMIDGYMIAEELGLDFHSWASAQYDRWYETSRWDLGVLHLRIMLFCEFRADHMGGNFTGYDPKIDSLLQAISEKPACPISQSLLSRKDT